ncbi:DUF4367 domain-containing protein [Lachnospiraceae bacterium 54-53]
MDFLPFEYRNILFLRYCFEDTAFEIDKILQIKNTESKLLYIQKMLSQLIGLENIWIDDGSMKRACKLSLAQNMKDYNRIKILRQPNYSSDFRRKLKDINIKQNSMRMLMLTAKRVAVFIIVCIFSFSAVLAVNANIRDKFINWIIETFPKFSIFTPQNTDENNNSKQLTSLKINYIPDRFELVDINNGRNMLIYNYSSKNEQRFDIKLFASSAEGKSYYDTENVTINEFIFKGSEAYIWQTDKMTYLICYQDSIECHISGNLSKDEILKVAEKISK